MTLKSDMTAFQTRWAVVHERQREERLAASLTLRWQQLNAAYSIAKGLGLLRSDPDEIKVFERWAKLKEKHANHP